MGGGAITRVGSAWAATCSTFLTPIITYTQEEESADAAVAPSPPMSDLARMRVAGGAQNKQQPRPQGGRRPRTGTTAPAASSADVGEELHQFV